GQPLTRNATIPLPWRTSTTSVVHDIVLVVSLSASGSKRLTVTSYVHFAPFASGSGSAAIISWSVIGRFSAPLLQAPSASRQTRRVFMGGVILHGFSGMVRR